MFLEVSRQASEINYFDYVESRDKKAKVLQIQWDTEFKRVHEWTQHSYPSLGHESVFSRYEHITELLAERKKKKIFEKAQKTTEKPKKTENKQVEAMEVEDEQSEDLEQDSGSR